MFNVDDFFKKKFYLRLIVSADTEVMDFGGSAVYFQKTVFILSISLFNNVFYSFTHAIKYISMKHGFQWLPQKNGTSDITKDLCI